MNQVRAAFIRSARPPAANGDQWLEMMAAHLPEDRFDVRVYEWDGIAHCDPRFDPSDYDVIQVARAAGDVHVPQLLKERVVEFVAFSRFANQIGNAVFTIHETQGQRRRWHEQGGDIAKSAVIRFPVSRPATDEDLRKKLGIPTHAAVVGCHQGLGPFDMTSVEALADLTAQDVHLLIMGRSVTDRIDARELGRRNVHFIECVEDPRVISAFLNTLDVFADAEGEHDLSPKVLAEAMAHETPCAIYSLSARQAAQETLGPGGIATDDFGECRDALHELLSNDGYRLELGRRAARHANEYFSLEKCVGDLAEVYEAIHTSREEARAPVMAGYGPTDLGFLYAGNIEEPGLAHYVATGGIPEEFEVHVARFFLPDTETLLDIGAHTGLYCFIAAKDCPPGAEVHVFEPQPKCCETMRKTIALNNWEDIVRVHEIALGNERGSLPIHLAGTGTTFVSAFNDSAPAPTLSVSVDTLDDQVERLQLQKIDFIKIDVEGFEQNVLEGGAKTIERDRPVLLVEIADRIHGRNFRNPNYGRTLRWLEQRDYSVWKCTERGRLIRTTPGKQQDALAMYLCLHRSVGPGVLLLLRRWTRQYRIKRWQERWKRYVTQPVARTYVERVGRLRHTNSARC